MLLILAAVVPPWITVNRYKRSVESVFSRTLGRPVRVDGAVSFRLLPQPALVLSNLVIGEDPAFGAEPMLRAAAVTARLRLASLWRGRFEVAQLSFKEPSWNFVRNAEGRWNIEGVLRNASQVRTAPTGLSSPQPTARFPYVETDSGRINIKIGNEKLAHALLDTDFALWQENTLEWRFRLEGSAVRTDAYLSDTGTLRVNGSLVPPQSGALEKSPFKLDFVLDRGQLGQLTHLLTGRDRGWRGNVNLSGTVEGTVADLRAAWRAEISDFRRYDVATTDAFDLSVSCNAAYLGTENHRASLACRAPFGKGELAVRVRSEAWRPQALAASGVNLAASDLARLYRRAKRDVPQDLTGTGTVNARIAREDFVAGAWTGEIEAKDLTLSSASQGASLAFEDFLLAPPKPVVSKRSRQPSAPAPTELRLAGSTVVMLTDAPNLQTEIVLGTGGFDAQLKGASPVASALAAARVLGLVEREYAASGSAILDLALHSDLRGFAPVTATGTIRISDLHSTARESWLSPLQVRRADVILSAGAIDIKNLSATLTGTQTQWDGFLHIPRSCEEEACAATFDLRANTVDAEDWNATLNPRLSAFDWLALPRRIMGGGGQRETIWQGLEAEGKLTIGTLTLRELIASKVVTNLRLHRGVILLQDANAELLGGRHLGEWTFDLTGDEPAYSGKGSIFAVSASSACALAHADGCSGAFTANYDLRLVGTNAAALLTQAQGAGTFTWQKGGVRALSVAGRPFSFQSWRSGYVLAQGQLALREGLLAGSEGAYQASGKVDLTNRTLDLHLQGPRGIVIGGSWTRPIAATSEPPPAQSASNPKDAKTDRSVPARR